MSDQRFLENNQYSLVNYGKTKTKNPINLLNTDFSLIDVQYENIGWRRMQVYSSQGTSNGVKHSFTINYNNGMIGDQKLVISLPGAGVSSAPANLSYYSMTGFAIIKTITIYHNGFQMHKYTGHALFQYLMFANRTLDNGKAAIITQSTGITTGNTATGRLYIPLLIEGNLGITKQARKPYYIGCQRGDLQIDIELNTLASITNGTAATSVPTALAEIPYILYKKYRGDTGNKLIGRTSGSGLSTIFTYKMPELKYYTFTITHVDQLTFQNVDASPLFQEKSDCLALLLDQTLTTGDPFVTTQINQMQLILGNDYLYEHYDHGEAIQINLDKYGETPYYTSTYPLYTIPLCYSPAYCLNDDMLETGIDLFSQTPHIACTGASGANYYLNVCALFQSFTLIMDDSSVKRVLTYDPKYAEINTKPDVPNDITVKKPL